MQYGHNGEALKSIDYNNSIIISASIDRCLHLFDKNNGSEIKEIEHDGIGMIYSDYNVVCRITRCVGAPASQNLSNYITHTAGSTCY